MFQEPQFKNKIVGENDITLQCVDQIYGGKSAFSSCFNMPQTSKCLVVLCSLYMYFLIRKLIEWTLQGPRLSSLVKTDADIFDRMTDKRYRRTESYP